MCREGTLEKENEVGEGGGYSKRAPNVVVAMAMDIVEGSECPWREEDRVGTGGRGEENKG